MRAVRELDPFYDLRGKLSAIADYTAEWAGIPMPLEGERLVIEPSYPWAGLLSKPVEEPDPNDPDVGVVRNEFWSRRYRATIQVIERKDGKVVGGWRPGFHSAGQALRTMGCSIAWGVEQEGVAIQTLGRMLRHHQFKHYLLTGMFIESSARSGVRYIFRKLRPTIALAPWRNPEDESVRILACLCQHPIAYYADSWAGAMCPTDDVIAALALMRGDEPMFWKRSTQHPPYRPEAGL